MNAWLPQASYPCGSFSDTSSCKLFRPIGSIGNISQFVFTLERQIKRALPLLVHIDLTLRHLRYHLTDVPPRPNFPPDNVIHAV